MQKKLELFINKLKESFSKERVSAFFADKKKRTRFIAVCIAAAIILATVIFAIVYVNDYYRVDGEALIGYTSNTAAGVSIEIDDNGVIMAIPDKAVAGLIFYPGGKVEYLSYLPLMLECAERGILCALVEMPLNLAVLDVNAADGITEQFPDVSTWYIGGHSLGGSMAASYLSSHTDEIDGLILLGSYSTADVSDTPTLSIYGEKDGVMNREKYDKYKSNLPDNLVEIVIEGGNHAYFGVYGEQKGDGTSDLTPSEQIEITADHIIDFIITK